MTERLVVSPSPHWKTDRTVSVLMLDVVVALVPAVVASVVFFGWRALTIILTSVTSAVVSEAVYEKAVKREVTVKDFSAVITGTLLAMNMPPGVPLWVPAIGSAFAIIVAKQIFGGLGCNFVNPALAGRAFLMAAWPLHMTRDWLAPGFFGGVDAASSPTPLAVLKGAPGGTLPGIWDMLVGKRAGCLGETSIIAILIGGIYLIWREVIDPRIPAGFIGTVFLLTWIFGKPGAFFQGDAVYHVLSGGLFLGAFFMATDYVTSPVTAKGRLLMGIGCGVITVLIRLWGGYPEGVSYSILLMNLVTPLIDRVVVPRYYGWKHEARKEKAL